MIHMIIKFLIPQKKGGPDHLTSFRRSFKISPESQVRLLFGFLWSGSVKAYPCSFGIDAAKHEQGAGAGAGGRVE